MAAPPAEQLRPPPGRAPTAPVPPHQTRSHFDAPPAVQHRRRRAACRTRSCPCAVRWLCGQQCVVASRRFPLPSSSVSAQRAQCQPPLPAELAPAQPLGGTVRFRKRWPTVPDEPIGSPSGRRFWDVVRRTPSVSRARKKVPSGACPTGLGTRKRPWIWRFMLTCVPLYRTFGRSMTPNGHPGSVGCHPSVNRIGAGRRRRSAA